MLVDAQSLSRTTLFALDHERASEQTYRGIFVISVFLILMFSVTGILLFIGPFIPSQNPVIARTPTVLTPPIFPTSPPTLSAIVAPTPTEIPAPTPAPVVATATRTPTKAAIVAPTPGLLTATPVYIFPSPKIIGPLPNGGTWQGEGKANAALTFEWKCECALGLNDWYEVVIAYVDRSGVPRVRAGRTRETLISLRRIYEGGGFELYQQAKEDAFSWFVQIRREPGNQPVSPPSETWKFIWQ